MTLGMEVWSEVKTVRTGEFSPTCFLHITKHLTNIVFKMVCSSVQSNDNPNTCFIFNFAETTQLKIDTCHCIEKPLEGL